MLDQKCSEVFNVDRVCGIRHGTQRACKMSSTSTLVDVLGTAPNVALCKSPR
jgi:hypothetical protein